MFAREAVMFSELIVRLDNLHPVVQAIILIVVSLGAIRALIGSSSYWRCPTCTCLVDQMKVYRCPSAEGYFKYPYLESRKKFEAEKDE